MKLLKIIITTLISLCFSNVYADDVGVAYIFSGYNSSPSKPLYQKIGKIYRDMGITPVYVEIDWRTNDIENYVSQAREKLKRRNSHKNYFYGFSLGGLVALSMASEFGAEKVVVSSVAPFFREDIKELPWYSAHKVYNWWLFGNNKSISLSETIEKINQASIRVILLAGANERSIVLERGEYIAGSLVNGTFKVMRGIGHGVSQPGHINYIDSALRQ